MGFNFKCELKETMLMPENAVFRIVDVAIPNTFTTMMSGINDKLYWSVSNTNPVHSRPQTGFTTTLAENIIVEQNLQRNYKLR